MRSQTVSETGPVSWGVFSLDEQGVIRHADTQAKILLGVSDPKELHMPTSFPVIWDGIQPLMENGGGQIIASDKGVDAGLEVHVLPGAGWGGETGETTIHLCLVRTLEEAASVAWSHPSVRDMHLQFQALMDHSAYGIYILDGKGIVLRVNEVAAGLIGMNRDAMIGMNIEDLSTKGIVDQALTPFILKSKKPLTRPLYVIQSNKYIMASGIPVFDDGGKILFVVVIEHDMTIVKDLREQLEQARQVADTIKSELSDRNLLEIRNSEIIAESSAMNNVLKVLLKLAKMDASNILITGESGTGKGFTAKFVHRHGTRHKRPFISINCAALPEMLLEAELFGYEKGAFTGASDKGKAGLFELANQGTLFLDEIGDLPFNVQAKLLKCLDDGEIRRVGGTRPIKVDCIIIAATNQNLEELVRRKKFRQDLYFRLNIFPVHIPPLRERREDILNISNFYLAKYNKSYQQQKRFSEKCTEELLAYDYPGNVRELKNLIKNAVVIKENNLLNSVIPTQRFDIPVYTPRRNSQVPQLQDARKPLGDELLTFEREKLLQAMQQCTSTRDLADYLGVSQSTASRKLRKHGLSFE